MMKKQLLILIALLFMAVGVSAQSVYPLSPPTGYTSIVITAINDNGMAVGYYANTSGGLQAFAWTEGGGMIMIGNQQYARGMNNAGQIVGDDKNGNSLFWANSSTPAVIISAAGTNGGIAKDINDNGLVVGRTGNTIANPRLGYIWNSVDNSFQTVNVQELNAINNGCLTTGSAILGSGRLGLYDHCNSQLSVIGDNGTWAFGIDINNSGTFIGSQNGGHFIQTGALVTTLPGAQGINDLGQVVGANLNIAYIWENNVSQDLNDLLNEPLWDFRYAEDINNFGWIVGSGVFNGQNAAFVYKPAPPPPLPVHNVTQNLYYNTIQAAIDVANPNDVIEVSDVTAETSININVDVTIDLSNMPAGIVTDNKTFTLTTGVTSTFIGSISHVFDGMQIILSGENSLTVNNLNIGQEGNAASNKSCVLVNGIGNNLILEGVNNLDGRGVEYIHPTYGSFGYPNGGNAIRVQANRYIANDEITISGSGVLNAISANWCAGIGGKSYRYAGKVVINSGTVNATGGSMAAGIGGGQDSGRQDENAATWRPVPSPQIITINGGNVTAIGGATGAGIGTGGDCYNDSNGGLITIIDGTVTATGGNHGAGIGCGRSNSIGGRGTGGILTFVDGIIISIAGGDNAAGIGGGGSYNAHPGGNCGIITIYPEANISATGGANVDDIGPGLGGDPCTFDIIGAPSPVTSISNITTECTGSTLSLPVTVTDFNNVGAISLVLNYDHTILSIASVDLNAAIQSGGGYQVLPNGILTISYFSDLGVNLANGATLFTINFDYVGAACPDDIVSEITFDYSVPGYCEYAPPGLDSEPYTTDPPADYFIAGSVSIDRTTPPAEVGGPVAIASTVECASEAIAPTTLPVVKDACGLTLSPTAASPIQHSVNHMDFSMAVTTGPDQAPETWYTDRYAPAGFESQVVFAGDQRLKHSIHVDDGASNRPAGFSGAFYNTQGRKYDLGVGTDYMEIKLYIPSGWATTNKRMAGFWGTAFDAANAISGYPIVEFASDNNDPRFQVWDVTTGWVSIGLPTGFTYDAWHLLKIKILPSGQFLYKAGDLNYTTVSYGNSGSVYLGNVILQGYNYDPDIAGAGVTYDIYWDDFMWNDTYSEPACEGIISYTYDYVDCAGHAFSWIYTYTIDRSTPPAEVGDPVAIASTVECESAAVAPTLPEVQDVCGNVLPAPTPGISGTYTNCEGTKIYTYTYVDCAGLTFVWVYTYTVERSINPIQTGTPVPIASTVECAADAVAPTTLPVIEDVCGNILVAPTPAVDNSGFDGCEGTITYTYTYEDCAGLPFVWVYTYTVERSTNPTETGTPVSIASTVECIADATAPTTLPVVEDVCGTILTAPAPVMDNSGIVGCEGTITYTYTYQDCAGLTFDWVYTYTVERSTNPTETGTPVSIASTVECIADATAPTTLPVVEDVCGNILTAPVPVMDNTGIVGCEGTITYTYTYEDCAGLEFIWVYTYTVERITNPIQTGTPVSVASTVECIADATAPITLPVVEDVCGTILTAPTPTVDNSGFDGCEGTVIYTYTYEDCADLQFIWVYTYTVERSTAPNEVGGPVATASTVECEAAAIAPTTLPVVQDVCGTVLTPTGPVIDGTFDGCQGTITYTYTYTDCANLQFVWVYTYTVLRTTPPAVPADGGSTVYDLADAVAPTPPAVTDVCGVTLNAVLESVVDYPDPFIYPGTRTYNYSYTDCAGLVSNWKYVYTIPGVQVSGIVSYYNNANTPMNNVDVDLMQGVNIIESATTDGSGLYSFNNVAPGTYDVVFSTIKPVGGINSSDAAQVNYWAANNPIEIEKVRFYAGDVAGTDIKITSLDALRIQAYFLEMGNPLFDRNPWTFWTAGETISENPGTGGNPALVVPAGGPMMNKNFYALVTGDFNRSFTPGNSKSTSESLSLIYGDVIEIAPNTAFELPINAAIDMEVGAVSLIINVPANQLEVQGVYLTNDPSTPLNYSVTGDELRISWYSLTPINLNDGDALLTLQLFATDLSGTDNIYLSLAADPLNELADGSYNVIENALISVDIIKATALGIGNPDLAGKLRFANYPNPFKGNTNFAFTVPTDGKATLEVYNITGTSVMVMLDQVMPAGDHQVRMDAGALKPGVYMATLTLKDNETMLRKTIKVIAY